VAVVAGVMLPQMLGGVAPLPEPAPSAEAAKGSLDYVPPTWPEAPDARAMLTRLGVGTAVVLVLCVGSLVVCRRWLRRLPGPGAGNSRMTLVETLPLGNRCLVHLVRVGDQQLLVGLDAGGLKSLVALPGAFEEVLVVRGDGRAVADGAGGAADQPVHRRLSPAPAGGAGAAVAVDPEPAELPGQRAGAVR
jgi:flagellar biogenesis protein FliO